MVDTTRVTSYFDFYQAGGFTQIDKVNSFFPTTGTSYLDGTYTANVSNATVDLFAANQTISLSGSNRFGFRVPYTRQYQVQFSINLTDCIYAGGAYPYFSDYSTGTLVEVYVSFSVLDSNNDVATRTYAVITKTNAQLGVYTISSSFVNPTRQPGNLVILADLYAGDFIYPSFTSYLYYPKGNANYSLFYQGPTIKAYAPSVSGSLIEVAGI